MEVFNSESCRPECETGVISALPEAPEPSFREKSAQRGRLQTDRVLTQLPHPHGSALHLSLSADSLVQATWSVRNQGWGSQRSKIFFVSCIVLCACSPNVLTLTHHLIWNSSWNFFQHRTAVKCLRPPHWLFYVWFECCFFCLSKSYYCVSHSNPLIPEDQ